MAKSATTLPSFLVLLQVTMGFPKPSKDCDTQTVTVPEVKCEDIVESRCQNIPR